MSIMGINISKNPYKNNNSILKNNITRSSFSEIFKQDVEIINKENNLDKDNKKLYRSSLNIPLTYTRGDTYSNISLKDKKITNPEFIKRLEVRKRTDPNEKAIESVEMITNVMKLDIANNGERYFDKEGKLKIGQVFNDCGTSLKRCTISESFAIFGELYAEGLIDKEDYSNIENSLIFQWGMLQRECIQRGIDIKHAESIATNLNDFLKYMLRELEVYIDMGDNKKACNEILETINFIN